MEGRLVVAKVGTSTLVDSRGVPDAAFIDDLAGQALALVSGGARLVIVSSGAAAAGRERLGFSERPRDIPTLQACAAAGQPELMAAYERAFSARGRSCAQLLLSRRDVVDRESYLNARNTLERLLELGVVPVINENDSVSVAEFSFGDNDMLGAIVAALLGADLYVILSDVEGFYTADPSTHPEATLIPRVRSVDEAVRTMATGSGSGFGTGGMASKVRAARAMLAAGIPTVICDGRAPRALERVAAGEALGTRFEGEPGEAHESPRKLWIGLAEVARGTLTLDAGAVRAVLEKGASILPVGVVRSEGSYRAGDVVNVCGPTGELVGRGVVRYSSDDMARFHGLRLDVIARFVDAAHVQPAVHRDELLVF